MVLVSLKHVLLCSNQSSWIKTKICLVLFPSKCSLKICWNLQSQAKIIILLQSGIPVWTRQTAQHPNFVAYQQWCRTLSSQKKEKSYGQASLYPMRCLSGSDENVLEQKRQGQNLISILWEFFTVQNPISLQTNKDNFWSRTLQAMSSAIFYP